MTDLHWKYRGSRVAVKSTKRLWYGYWRNTGIVWVVRLYIVLPVWLELITSSSSHNWDSMKWETPHTDYIQILKKDACKPFFLTPASSIPFIFPPPQKISDVCVFITLFWQCFTLNNHLKIAVWHVMCIFEENISR